ncbi:MAG: methionyl-tRNA formyltransferase [Lactobacillaceae bacterium]|jgi:methionyl-tRNA formyltransferase|nr:methionyl-tRNA formyltransferase [Lactobacillaceae bacterium]
MKKQTVIFMGTAEFSAKVLQSLIDNPDIDVIAVVSQPDRIGGRKKELIPTDVHVLAEANNIPVYQPQKLSGSPEMEELINLQADFLVTAAFGQFLPTKFLDSAKVAAINVHASLLPKYRGAAPINWAIINGDKITGISIMYMVKAMDAGDVISTVVVPIEDEDNAGSLFDKMAIAGASLLNETIPTLVDKTATPQAQNENEVTLAPKITSELLQLDFKNQAAEQIVNLVRGLNPMEAPFFNLGELKIKVLKASAGDEVAENSAKIFEYDKKGFSIVAADKRQVFIETLQLPGKNPVSYKDFINGAGRNFEPGQELVKL